MRRLGLLVLVCVAMLLSATVIHSLAQDEFDPPPPAYNPYPPGILPSDLNSEIVRVRREINFIFSKALGEWKSLPPPNYQGNPPTIQGSGYNRSRCSAS